jgi:CubicO group peptidase (beta-lactamase class C family)
MQPLADDLDATARRTGFSGVVRVDGPDGVEFARAYGMAHRGLEIPNTVDTVFAVASATKGLTALTVMSLIEDGTLDLTTTARSVLGEDLPLIGDDVTVEHLLAHRSGIGDYLDEDDGHGITDYVMPIPVHELATTEAFLAVLDGFPTVFHPDERFAYNNGGFVVLALIAERAGGEPYHDLVRRRVCEPAGMVDTGFPRSDELPGRAALNYLTDDGPRTNVFHVPVRGSGDGGAFSTASDVRSLWIALFDGRIVSTELVAEMVRPRSDWPVESKRYGLGFWIHDTSDVAMLEGYDAGISFRSMHDPGTGTTSTVISNTSEGAWPIVERLEERLDPPR